jgi:hypothetical protein
VAVVVVLVVLVLLAVAAVVGEGYASAAARDYVRERVLVALALPDDADIEVDVPGLVLVQALSGRLDVVDVVVPEADFGALRGTADFHAEDVPFDGFAPLGTLRGEFSIAEPDLAPIAGDLSGLELESIELEEPEVVVATSFRILGAQLPIAMGLEPSAVDGGIVFTPTTVRVGDEVFDADDLRADPFFGSLARDLLVQQSFCVAEHLPAAFTVTDVDVRGDDLVLAISGDGAVLGGPDIVTRGVCTP